MPNLAGFGRAILALGGNASQCRCWSEEPSIYLWLTVFHLGRMPKAARSRIVGAQLTDRSVQGNQFQASGRARARGQLMNPRMCQIRLGLRDRERQARASHSQRSCQHVETLRPQIAAEIALQPYNSTHNDSHTI